MLLEANQGAIQEGLVRLAQTGNAGSAGLEILGAMLVASDGSVDSAVVRSIGELRTVCAPVMARFAAERAERRHVVALRKIVQQMREAEDDTAELARSALDFWAELVAATNNVAFTLAFNSLAVSYGSVLEHLHQLLAVELRAVDEYDLLVDAIAARKGYAAAERAAGIVAHGTAAIERLVEALDAGQSPRSRRPRRARS